ncbi:MAG: MFS transporter [SAR202 cluster bacterium]|nr:MFS transporter [SAR202 cluster bacterium]
MMWERLFTAFRIPAYRWMWSSSLAAAAGFQPYMVGQGWLLYDLTESPFIVGLAPGLGAAANLLFAPFGGVLADRMDRRLMVMLSQGLMALAILTIGVLVVADLVEVWHVLVMSMGHSVGMSLQRTSRNTFLLDVVGRNAFMNAMAGQFMSSQIAGLVGPFAAGFIIAGVGVGYLFLILGSIIVLGAFLMLKVAPVPMEHRQTNSVFGELRESINFIRKNRPVRGVLLTVLITEGLGFSAWSMFPVIATEVLNGGPVVLGMLSTCRGLGGVVGTVVISSFGDIKSKGTVLFGAAITFGALLVLFSFSRNIPLSLFLIGLTGAASIMYNTQAQTVLPLLSPAEMRGRVMGLHSVVLTSIGFGALGMGAVASLVGVTWSVLGGGSLVAVNGLGRSRMAGVINREAGREA